MLRAAYLRYRSRIAPHGRPPITLKVIDVEKISPLDIIVAVKSPSGRLGRRYMFMHLDRQNGRVWYLREDAQLEFTGDGTDRIQIGVNGEFVTP